MRRRTTRILIPALLAALVAASVVVLSGPLAATAYAAPGPAPLDPALKRQLGTTPGFVSGIVVLGAQADPGTVRVPGRAQRRQALIKLLRSTATSGQKAVRSQLDQLVTAGQVASYQPLWITDAVQVRGTAAAFQQLAARPDVLRIEADAAVAMAGTAAPSGDTAGPQQTQANVPALWAQGLDGTGVVVANLDTGVDVTHPDLAGSYRGGSDSWFDPNGQHPTSPVDVDGHGTWTMGVMVGGGSSGTTIGAAPGARWIAAKIFDDRGQATATNVHRAFQWVLDPDGDPATNDSADVVNNSWTLAAGACDTDFEPDLVTLRAASVLPVFAAGNGGPQAGTVASPADNVEALAVGNIDSSGLIDPSSARGPSPCGTSPSPNVVAPGVGVTTTDLYGGYTTQSGTSLSAPLVSGISALLLQSAPGDSPDQLQAALQDGAVDLGAPGPDDDYGAGGVDALAAYQRLGTAPDFALTVAPSSAEAAPGGTLQFQASVAPVNGFAADVSVAASGLPAAVGSVSVTPSTVPGGSGSATVQVDLAPDAAAGQYLFHVQGSGGARGHGTEVTVTVTAVAAQDFTLAATPAARKVVPGTRTTYAVTVGAVNGFAGTVGLSVSGLPATVGSAAVSPASVTGSGTATVTVTTVRSAPAGTYALSVAGTSGALAHSVTVSLQVAPDWAMRAAPTSAVVTRGGATSFTIKLTVVAGACAPVQLAVSGVPSGTAAAFGRNPVRPPTSVVLTVRTSRNTPRGTFRLAVTGTGSGWVHQLTVTLTVR